MARLLGARPGEIIDESWSPLDSTEAPDYVPTVWAGFHVGLRLVEAFRTLSRMPAERGPGGHKTLWPAYRAEWNEYFAAMVGETQELIASLQASRNRVRLQASAEDIQRMEVALAWPARYLGGHDRLLCIIVNEVAYYRAKGLDLEAIVHKMRPRSSQNTLRHRNQTGLDRIALGLRVEEVPIF
jgi:hypothetical protein